MGEGASGVLSVGAAPALQDQDCCTFPAIPGRGQAGLAGAGWGTERWGMDRETQGQDKSYSVSFGDRQMGSNPSLLLLACVAVSFHFLGYNRETVIPTSRTITPSAGTDP